MKKVLASFILIFTLLTQVKAASPESERIVDQIMKLTNQIRDLIEIRNYTFYSMNKPAGDVYKPWTPMYQAMIKSTLLALRLYTPARGGEGVSPDQKYHDNQGLYLSDIDDKILGIL